MYKEFHDFSNHLAQVSGKIIRQYFRKKVTVDSKNDFSPVTITDKKSEELMREEILKHFPDHGIIGEEFGNHNTDAEYVWVLDPIDGTKSFISGALTFGTLIALLQNGKPILGVINQPIINEFLIGDNGEAKLNDAKVTVRSCDKISDAVLLTTDHFNIGKYQDQNKFDALAKKVKLYRHWGDCYGYLLLASGYADIMIDPIMNLWDSMALIPIIRGAGGIISDYQGNDPVKGNNIVASSPAIHAEIIKTLN
ncbi:MAG: histidinol-phosphatase [Ignavibacterium sp.]|nr:histidinol-phosphatase [Ignavibacterium sp.]